MKKTPLSIYSEKMSNASQWMGLLVRDHALVKNQERSHHSTSDLLVKNVSQWGLQRVGLLERSLKISNLSTQIFGRFFFRQTSLMELMASTVLYRLCRANDLVAIKNLTSKIPLIEILQKNPINIDEDVVLTDSAGSRELLMWWKDELQKLSGSTEFHFGVSLSSFLNRVETPRFKAKLKNAKDCDLLWKQNPGVKVKSDFEIEYELWMEFCPRALNELKFKDWGDVKERMGVEE